MPPGRHHSISQPHSISLKVLRLSRPSLALAEPLPGDGPLHLASLAHSAQSPSPFPLTSLLTLPPSFGAAYVGEPFSCTLSANNELPDTAIQSIRIEAELQTPSAPTGIPLLTPTDPAPDLAPSKSHQRIVQHDLTEEGQHVLAVTVSYTEPHDEGPRHRSFRKLYQFAAQQALGVRTKVGAQRGGWAVEAQIENLSGAPTVVDDVVLEEAAGVKARSITGERVTLGEGDVLQVAFWAERAGEMKAEQGRWVLGRLKVGWRMGMGQEGTLRTGMLGCLRKD